MHTIVPSTKGEGIFQFGLVFTHYKPKSFTKKNELKGRLEPARPYNDRVHYLSKYYVTLHGPSNEAGKTMKGITMIKSRMLGLLVFISAIMTFSVSGCSSEESLEDLCVDGCSNQAAANCKNFNKDECEKVCKEKPSDEQQKIRDACESQVKSSVECMAKLKYKCENDVPVQEDPKACSKETTAFLECIKDQSKKDQK